MPFECDKPIEKENEDLLGRSGFAKSFARGLVDLSQQSNFIVSLNGPWGSGKTSLIHLVQNEIIRIRDYEEISYYPLIINFAPWNTLDQNGIITQFFNCFLSSFSDVRIKNGIKKFIKSNYTKGAVEIAKTIPSLNVLIKTIQGLFGKYLKSFLEEDSKDLYALKDEITNRLLKSPFKYIVFIDDIDRLNNNEIKLIIQLVKAVCDFPNVIYVLSFDKKIVANALSQEQTSDGEKYLEKIVQMPIDLPQVSYSSLNEYFYNKIEKTIPQKQFEEIDLERWQNAKSRGLFDYFNNIRDVNRFVNAVAFKIASLQDKIDIVDLLIVEAIRIFDPVLLSHLYDNRFLIIPHENSFISDRKKLIEEFNKKASEISQHSSLLSIIFPMLYTFGEFSSGISAAQLKSRGRICVEENFYTYFQTNLTNNDLKITDVQKYILSEDVNFRKDWLNSLNNKHYYQFLECLYGFIKDGKYIENIKKLYLEIVDIDYQFKDLTKLFNSHRIIWLEGIASEMLKNMGEPIYKDFTINIIKQTHNYGLIIRLMYFLTKGTGFYYEKQSNDALLKNETVADINKILLESVKSYSNDEKFIEDEYFLIIIHYLINQDKQFIVDWYKKNTNNIYKFMHKLISFGYGEDNKRFVLYRFNHNEFDEFVDIESLRKNIIDSLKTTSGENSLERLGKILFLMPDNTDGYQLQEIFDYCKDNNIKFYFYDHFIDE